MFLAEDSRIARRVALKMLAARFDTVSPERLKRFRREAEVIARLEHAHICGIYDADLDADTPWIAMRHVEGEPLADIVPELPPGPDDVILIKQYASAFFGTSLAAMLTARGADTLIVTGCSTSGCIRATAVDAMQTGFRPIVPRECVGDRHEGPHEANLFDINAKYGDVVSLKDVMSRLDAIPWN